MSTDRYPPIEDYGFISDCHSAALVARDGSIDWCCMPRYDSASVFGRLLDWDRGGFCALAPAAEEYGAARAYVDESLVLATTFHVRGGEAVVYDCFTMRRGGAREPHRQLLRIVEGKRGSVEFRLSITARFDYGGVAPWLRHHGDHLYTLIGGNDALVVSCDARLAAAEHQDLVSSFTVRAGRRVRLSLVSVPPEDVDPVPPPPPSAAENDRRMQETLDWWRAWVAKTDTGVGTSGPAVRRSAAVLKGLTNAPTGAVVAAPTTSLPEAIGGNRNWDYRYSWVRDSQFTVRSLGALGAESEADGFRRFIERSAAGSAESLQIMYGVGGERRLTEACLDLEGYRKSAPVRVGNGASSQVQLDVYGYLLDLAWRWHQRGRSPDDDYWRFLVSLADAAADKWQEPDHGIWEIRGEPKHFVHSKAMCWVTLDRGICLAEQCMRAAPLPRWKKTRDEIRRTIESKGYDKRRGVFVREFGSDEMDASLLLLPTFDFIDYRDERMVRTTDRVAEDLDDHGLLRRYVEHDRLDGHEGAFIACTFWLVECYAHQGRLSQAQTMFDRATSTANDLGLFSEEFDPEHRACLGNFPQGLTHLSHIVAAVALGDAATAVDGS